MSQDRNTPASSPPELVVVQRCPLCQDTGYLGYSHPLYDRQAPFCTCEIGQQAQRRYSAVWAGRDNRRLQVTFAQAGLPAEYQDCTLESLEALAAKAREQDVDLLRDKERAVSAVRMLLAEGQVDLRRVCEDANEARKGAGLEPLPLPTLSPTAWKPKPGLCLTGPFGTGKTGLTAPLVTNALRQGQVALWIQWWDFVGRVQEAYSGRGQYSSQELRAQAQQTDLLVVDDFGDPDHQGEATPDQRRIAYEIVNYRHNHRLPLVLTTNLDFDHLRTQFGQRITDRIAMSCVVLSVNGLSLRTWKGAADGN